ncbi:MAG: ABC transporter substrate-binding protein [Cyanobacteriota bacterium]|nr:ABC transporter substrate-binding protein [Cyanobacteriota bacterium]
MMWHKKLLALTLIGFSIAIIPISCSLSPSPEPEIRIGLIAPLTGEFADFLGKVTMESAQLAVKEVNDAGGIQVAGGKRKVVLLIEDDRDTPDDAVEAARKLIYQENVVALTGLPLSRIAIPVAKIAENSRIPTISSWSSNPETTAGKKYVFRVPYTDDVAGKVIAKVAREELGYERAAVLYDIASQYNRDLAQFFKGEFEKIGGKIVAFESYTTDEKDLTTQLKNIQNSSAEVLFLPNYSQEISNQVQQINNLGLNINFLGSETWSTLEKSDRLKLEGSFFTEIWSPSLDNAKTQAFVATYRQVYNQIPTTVAALSYDAMGLLFTAIEREGKADPESIRNGLANIGYYEGVGGKMSYQNGGDPMRNILILQLKDGEAVVYKKLNLLGE